MIQHTNCLYCGKLLPSSKYCGCSASQLKTVPYVSDDFQIGPEGAHEHVDWSSLWHEWKTYFTTEHPSKGEIFQFFKNKIQ